MARYEDILILKDGVSRNLIKMQKPLKDLNRKLGATEQRFNSFSKRIEHITKVGQKLKGIGQGMTVGVTLPILAMGGAMVKLASDMEETINKVDVSFGKNSDTVKQWAKNSIKTMGLAQQSALDSAALYGDMATGMGLSQEKAADMAMSLTQLGADLASFKNISNDVAQTALKSIFTGETESLKNLGVVMTQTNLEQFAMSKGIRKRIKDMTEAEKVNLRYNYVLEKTKNAHGDFERTGGGASNQMRMFQENLKELGVTFGQYILPYFTKAVKWLNSMLIKFNNLSPTVKKFILVIAGLAAAIGPLLVVLGTILSNINTILITFELLKIVGPAAMGALKVGSLGALGSLALVAASIAGIIAGLKAMIDLMQAAEQWKEADKRLKVNNLQSSTMNEKTMAVYRQKRKELGDREFKNQYGKLAEDFIAAEKQNKRFGGNTTNNTTNNNTTNISNYNASVPTKMKNVAI